ncbi:hypothetical protein D3C86_1899620 [compost metagenome]
MTPPVVIAIQSPFLIVPMAATVKVVAVGAGAAETVVAAVVVRTAGRPPFWTSMALAVTSPRSALMLPFWPI